MRRHGHRPSGGGGRQSGGRADGNYQADLKAVQDKLAQVIDAGVRQVAILADDAGNVGGKGSESET